MQITITNTTPKLSLKSAANLARPNKLYNAHTLYDKHQLYYGPTVNSDAVVSLTSVNDLKPKLTSVKEIYG